MEIKPIAHIHNGFTDKFGIPRQSREESCIVSRIVFTQEFRVREALRGIEEYSHLWLIWEFSAPFTSETKDWSPTVRPPRLGGNQRMGVFATRSPFRPNRLGLSSVRLIRIEETEHEGLVLIVTGADMLDGTPIYDIKPYLSFSDSHPDAINGFADATRDYRLEVVWPSEAASPSGASIVSIDSTLRQELEEILSQDPRPAYQDDSREYKLDYQGYKATFVVQNGKIFVKNIAKNA